MTSITKTGLFSLGLLAFLALGLGQDIVTDYDGNEYHSITIGTQVWMQENLQCQHYADGTEISDVAVYDNAELNASIYGRLYTWPAAMNGEAAESAQGICPDGWHIPCDAEWLILENYLGGASIAGGKMKETGRTHWNTPNTGADNSSGFSALPGGEYDAHYTPNVFRLLHENAVFWTSTSVSTSLARERYLSYDNAASSVYDWYKTMKYSIRAIKDSVTTSLDENEVDTPKSWLLYPSSPNPFNPVTTIPYQISEPTQVVIQIHDVRGMYIATLQNNHMPSGRHEVTWSGTDQLGKELGSGVYIVSLSVDGITQTHKMTLLR